MEEQKKRGRPPMKIIVPLDELEQVDVSQQAIEHAARGFILGTTAIGRRKEVRELLEDKVVKKIGKKGKYLTDKLFELIEGLYIVKKEHINKKGGRSIRYYKTPPNLQAIIYALDRVLGKPVQHIEQDRQKEGIVAIEQIIKNLESGKILQETRKIEITK